MKRIPAYQKTSDIINCLKDNLCKWFFYFFPISTAIFNEKQLIIKNPFIINYFKIILRPFYWFWKRIIRPILLLFTGLYFLVKNSAINYLVICSIVFFILIPLLNKYNINLIKSNPEIITYIILTLWLIISFFSFEYSYTKEDTNRIDLVVEKMKNSSTQEISSIKNNIQILSKRYNRQIVFLNSTIGFLWGFATLLIVSAYKKEQFTIVYEILAKYYYVFFFFLIVFILIRAYSKVYMRIFDISEFACNEALIKVENIED